MEKIIKDKIGNSFYQIRNGASIKQDKIVDGIPITRIESIAEGFLDKERLGYASINNDNYRDFYLQNGDILMSHINSEKHLGKVAYIEYINEPIIHGMNLLCLKADTKKIFPKYGFYYFKNSAFKSQIRKITKKSVNQASFNITNLNNLEITYPENISSQIRIAKILSWAENLIDDRRKSIDLLDDLLRSTFLEMFGDPLYNPKFSKKTFREISNVRQGLQIPISKRFTEPGFNRFPYITNQFINGGKIAEYIEKPNPNVICGPEDVLMTRTGNTGIVLSDVKGVFHNNFFIIDFNREIVNRYYLIAFLKLPQIRKLLIKKASTTTIPDLNHSDFYSVEIPIPHLSLQNQFAEIVAQVEAVKKDYKESLNELENLYASLSQQAFNGDLNLNKLDVKKELEEHHKKAGLTEEETKKEEPIIEDNSTVVFQTVTSRLSATFAEYGKLYETIEKLPKLPLSGLEAAIEAQNTLKNISETVTLNGIASVANSIVDLQKYNEKLNQSISPFLPSSSLAFLIEAQKSINEVIGNNDILKGEYFTPRQVIDTILETWEAGDISFNTQRIAKILTENFKDYHFDFEMALNCIKKNLDAATYYSTEELVKEPAKATDFDLNKIFTHALWGKNAFLRLKQHFYNAEEENFNLKLRDKDYESFKYKRKEDRSGIYFSIE